MMISLVSAPAIQLASRAGGVKSYPTQRRLVLHFACPQAAHHRWKSPIGTHHELTGCTRRNLSAST